MKKLLPLLIIPIMLVSCAEKATHTAFMMDTVITYDIKAEGCDALFTEADKTAEELENMLSAHIETSEISQWNDGKTTALSDAASDIVTIAYDVSVKTNGAYDITVAPLVELWNISGAADDFTPPTDEEIAQLLPSVGFKSLLPDKNLLTSAKENVRIDLGGIAKGYTCGRVASDMALAGAVGTVNFGGNVATVGNKSSGFRIGVKDPAAPDSLCGVLTLDSGIVSVSGGYERFVEYEGVRYHHIIDPKTGYPAASDLASAVVVMPNVNAVSGALADALSTALFVMGKDGALALYATGVYDFEAVLIETDGSITVTDGIGERFENIEQ